MIITKTPFRVSLFGGGTDYPFWYKEHGGEVVSFTIDKYCYLTTRVLPPFFNHNYRIAYSVVETLKSYTEIKHPAVREAIRKYCPDLSLEIHHDGDLPARSGVGSSSAFAVGLIHSLKLLKGQSVTSKELADEAITLEQEILQENVGSQDQVACALGGLNHIVFNRNSSWRAEKIDLSEMYKNEIENRMVLIYTGVNRISSNIQAHLFVDFQKKIPILNRTTELARECRNILAGMQDLDSIGDMLAESWELKRAMNSYAVTSELDELWSRAKRAGALGGKVLGAGGGGFCLFWVKKNAKVEFLNRFNTGTYVPTKIVYEGSTCILR
jgi:D-glycero-alpha-D-manno-heptose-7-phosphate kinase